MPETITFSYKGKSYNAIVYKEQRNSLAMWVVELDNGKTYLFSREKKGWYCGDLNKSLCKLIGSKIETLDEGESS